MAMTNDGGENEAMEAAAEPPESQSPGAYDDFDSTCSTPYVSAPSSPGRPTSANGYFYSAPASPMHFFAVASAASSASIPLESDHFPGRLSGSLSASATDFEFSARFPALGPESGSSSPATMISADELFLNGQIRPMRPSSSHLQKPPRLEPLLDDAPGTDVPESVDSLRGRDFRSKNRSIHRRTRSLSPLRSSEPVWAGFPPEDDEEDEEQQQKPVDPPPVVTAARRSRRWMSLKDFLYRSKSEGRGYVKEKLSWSALTFSSPSSKEKDKDKEKEKEKEKDKDKKSAASSSQAGAEKKKRASGGNGAGKRRVPAPSAHELHYAAKRAQAEEMRKKTYLPYRQGLLGCLGFSSRSYSVVNGFAKALHHHHNQPVPSS
ncbi:hypothetical protein EJ110_NYTH17678 [Nymphaea thermarum]|nr:hypothetical protein EJ110_NYTH17678 [Nymphaea thermarum]